MAGETLVRCHVGTVSAASASSRSGGFQRRAMMKRQLSRITNAPISLPRPPSVAWEEDRALHSMDCSTAVSQVGRAVGGGYVVCWERPSGPSKPLRDTARHCETQSNVRYIQRIVRRREDWPHGLAPAATNEAKTLNWTLQSVG